MNNAAKFISEKNENCGQCELTPLLHYILIKSQPERLWTNINYMKCFYLKKIIFEKMNFIVHKLNKLVILFYILKRQI